MRRTHRLPAVRVAVRTQTAVRAVAAPAVLQRARRLVLRHHLRRRRVSLQRQMTIMWQTPQRMETRRRCQTRMTLRWTASRANRANRAPAVSVLPTAVTNRMLNLLL